MHLPTRHLVSTQTICMPPASNSYTVQLTCWLPAFVVAHTRSTLDQQSHDHRMMMWQQGSVTLGHRVAQGASRCGGSLHTYIRQRRKQTWTTQGSYTQIHQSWHKDLMDDRSSVDLVWATTKLAVNKWAVQLYELDAVACILSECWLSVWLAGAWGLKSPHQGISAVVLVSVYLLTNLTS